MIMIEDKQKNIKRKKDNGEIMWHRSYIQQKLKVNLIMLHQHKILKTNNIQKTSIHKHQLKQNQSQKMKKGRNGLLIKEKYGEKRNYLCHKIGKQK